jgi:hypothetical protein
LAPQLRQEELRKLRERQAAAVDADEADLAREFSGSVTLTLNEQQEVTLSPDQARDCSLFPCRHSWGHALLSPCLRAAMHAATAHDLPLQQAWAQARLFLLFMSACFWGYVRRGH